MEKTHGEMTNTAVAEFFELWRSGANDDAAHAKLGALLESTPLCGRITHGIGEETFARLNAGKTHDTQEPKRLAWVFGPETLPLFLGKDAAGICSVVGMGDDWLRRETARAGKKFKLCVFPADDDVLQTQATWAGVRASVERAYPEVAAKVVARLPAIETRSYEDLKAEAGYHFGESSSDDSLKMTPSRLMRCEGSVPEVCQFLWDEIGARKDCFRGDGYSYNGDERLGKEYLALNRPLADMPGHAIIDLDVVPPPAAQ